jgi:Fe-S-cluster containining protein
MNLGKKQVIIERIYQIYDQFINGFDVACKKYCASCCTRNVTMTTLEGHIIAKFLKLKGKTDLYANIQKSSYKKRFIPQITINGMADLSLQGKNIPHEQSDTRWGECPLLTNNQCPVYQVRPFGCRCFVSRIQCKTNSYAEIDPFVFTVNSLFLQFIENVDQDGCFGNLTDILLFMMTGESEKILEKGIIKCQNTRMIANRPAKVFLIPPEHQDRIETILMALRKSLE